MANVSIKFNGKEFLLSCEDGQEEHLEELLIQINKKFNNLKNDLGNLGENKLLLITTVKVMDEYYETKKKVEEKKEELKNLSNKFKELKSLIYEYKDNKEQEILQLNNDHNKLKDEIEINQNESSLKDGKNPTWTPLSNGNIFETYISSKEKISIRKKRTQCPVRSCLCGVMLFRA